MELKAWDFASHCRKHKCCNLSHCCIELALHLIFILIFNKSTLKVFLEQKQHTMVFFPRLLW
jgi:hypothetical protein